MCRVEVVEVLKEERVPDGTGDGEGSGENGELGWKFRTGLEYSSEVECLPSICKAPGSQQ
jgi:hypothetical protein